MDVTVVVATCEGSRPLPDFDAWGDVADQRAVPSAVDQGVPVVRVHRPALHDSRNLALDLVATEWVCFLDADDELEPGYFDAMATGTADLRAPAVRYVAPTRSAPPRVPRVAGHVHACTAACLPWGNWLVVGTLVRSDLVRKIGGWHDFTWSEDWDLWVRCWKAGATIEAIPAAIYRAHVRPDSRNRGAPPSERLAAHRAIAEANGLPVP